MATDIFLSVGKTATKNQQEFVERVELLLAKEGFSIKRAVFSAVQPLKKITEVMQKCSGAVIVAHERLFIEEATELRGSANPISVKKVKLPTVWNQIESAMAYTLDLPLLVICDKHCRTEGLLENRYDWYVNYIEIDPVEIDSESFRGIFADWKERVIDAIPKKGQRGRKSRDGEMSVFDFLSGLTADFSFKAVSVIGATLAVLLSAAFAVGKYFGVR